MKTFELVLGIAIGLILGAMIGVVASHSVIQHQLETMSAVTVNSVTYRCFSGVGQ